MQSGFLNFRESTIHYLKAGNGEHALICLHGYGESALHFHFLSKSLSHNRVLIAIDLPYHGQTSWRSGVLDGSTMGTIIKEILIREGITNLKISLLGFSLGGRIVLAIYEQVPEAIDRIVLLAPDGFKINFWYWLATQTMPGRQLFKLTMQHPSWFLMILRAGNRLKLINQSIYKFVEYYIHDERVRTELLDRWLTMRNCKPDLRKIRNAIRKNGTKMRLLYGRYDRIILPGPALRFREGIDDFVTINLLECGHQVLHEKNVNAIKEKLSD